MAQLSEVDAWMHQTYGNVDSVWNSDGETYVGIHAIAVDRPIRVLIPMGIYDEGRASIKAYVDGEIREHNERKSEFHKAAAAAALGQHYTFSCGFG